MRPHTERPDEAIDLQRLLKNGLWGYNFCSRWAAAHLGGVLAANTVLPVVGIPIKAFALDAMDALLSTVQMPPNPCCIYCNDGAKNVAISEISRFPMSN